MTSKTLFAIPHVNIEEFPVLDTDHPFTKGSELTIGDLHGNALKLLYILLKQGIFTHISQDDYNAFVHLYKKDADIITLEDISFFLAMLQKAIIPHTQDNGGLFRLLGDDLADRGSNDFFTLMIMDKLFQQKVPIEILISNHSVEFINVYEKKLPYISKNLHYGQAASVANLQILIDNQLILRQDIDALFVNHYLPRVKLLSYALDDANNTLHLFSHAPVPIDIIRIFSEKFSIQYIDKTARDLAETLDNINSAFYNNYIKTNMVHTLFPPVVFWDPYRIDIQQYPVLYITWNRNYQINRPADYKGYKLTFTHGHDSSLKMSLPPHINNLDNNLGKIPGYNTDTYEIHFMANLDSRRG